MDIGAGNVQLIGRDTLGLVEPLDDRDVLAYRVAEDVDDDLAEGVALERRQLALEKLHDAHVLEPDGVQHAGCRLHNARRRVAGHRFQRDALGDESADPFQREDFFKLDAIAEGAAGGDDRVGQFDACQLNFHVGFHAAIVLLSVFSSQRLRCRAAGFVQTAWRCRFIVRRPV